MNNGISEGWIVYEEKFISAIMGIIMATGMPFHGKAQSPALEADKKNPVTMSSAELIDELYWFENDDDVYQCAKASAMILTGEILPNDYYGMFLIGTYRSSSVFYHSNISVPVGSSEVKASINAGFTMVLPAGAYPTAEEAAKNKAALNQLYETVWAARQETEGMSDKEKAQYLALFIQERLKKKAPIIGRTATCLQNGYADCDGFSGLYYIAANNCGLQVSTVLGTYLSESHAWNEVKLDGIWIGMDTVQENYLLSETEMMNRGYIKQH